MEQHHGFNAYQMHTALNLHFLSNNEYDFFKYNGRTNAKLSTFKRSRHRYAYVNIERRTADNTIELNKGLLRVFLLLYMKSAKSDTSMYIKPSGMFFKEIISNLEYQYKSKWHRVIKTDMNYLLSNFDIEYLLDKKRKDGQDLYPVIYNQYMEGNIELVTLVVFNAYIIKVLTREKSVDTISWPEKIKTLNKFTSFIKSVIINKREFNVLLTSLEPLAV